TISASKCIFEEPAAMAVDADDAGGRTPRRPSLPRPGLRDHANIAAAALFVAALAIAGTIAWRQHHRSPPAAPVVTVGAIDTPVPEAIVGTTVHIAGWALDPEGVRGVVIRVDGKPYAAQYGIPRPD